MNFTNDNFDGYINKEWLVTNGIGGFACSTVCGCNTRKYHGLLVSALGKTCERFLTLSKINESIIIKGNEYTISTNECHNYIENGYIHLEKFEKNFLPYFEYKIKNISIEKELSMKYGENKIGISYKVTSGKDDIVLKLQPLVNFRGFHETSDCYELSQSSYDNKVNISLNSKGTILHMVTSDGEYKEYKKTYYRNMFYREEENRGFAAYESHYMPGVFEIEIPKNSVKLIEFVASVDEENDYLKVADAISIIRGEKVRFEKLFKVANAKSDIQKELVVASDTFIIEKNNMKTIIAGYPWFGDWGRDTFISLEGLCLKTNRFKDAKEIIMSFKEHIKDGLIPNLITENGGNIYNTVDASLWYIDSVYKYYKYTNDLEFVKEIYQTIIDIISFYKNGTAYNIKMDDDFLINAGDENTQLTWMDAKFEDIIPTSRYGKPVEINALWYNAIKIAEVFSNLLNKEFDKELSKKIEKSFEKFYADNGLYDVIEPLSDKIRPNQIIACGIEFSPIKKEKIKNVLRIVQKELYTNKGLRTLSKEDIEYIPYYFGNSKSRDLSYHQGTVWPYLLMFYNETLKKYTKEKNEDIDVTGLLNDRCIGNVSEIYDGDEPRMPKGAFAQGWSVAMLMDFYF